MSGTVGIRLFLTGWLIYSVHFASNIIREHYPAFALAERGTLRVDDYLGLHDDIFAIPGRGAFINSNPGASIIAAVPYLLARPAIDAVVARAGRRVQSTGAAPAEYAHPRSDYRRFFQQVSERGLLLRFGLAAAVIHLLCTAPLAAAGVVVMRSVLLRLSGGAAPALLLALLYGFGTPVFLRAGFLNQNLLVAHFGLLAFALLLGSRVSRRARLLGVGLCLGLAVLCDYTGIVLMPPLAVYAWWRLRSQMTWTAAAARALWIAAGAAPPLVALLAYQQWAFGHALYPAQHYMPPTPYTSGWGGMSGPMLEVFHANLFSRHFGLFTFGPLLLLALARPFLGIPPPDSAAPGSGGRRCAFLGPPEAALIVTVCLGVCALSSSTRYAWVQWETGVRYLMPAVPFLFLAAAEVVLAMPVWLGAAVAAVAVAESWCLAMVRADPLTSVYAVVQSGPQLPVLTSLNRVRGPESAVLHNLTVSPVVVLLAVGLLVLLLWLPLRPGGFALDGRHAAHR
jgi:hypothetical protein